MQFNTEVIQYDHALHAFLVEAELKHAATVPSFDTLAPLLADAFVAGQRSPSTAAAVTVQPVRFMRDGAEVAEWEVADRERIIATADNPEEAEALARELNGGVRCDACERFELIARRLGTPAAS